LKDKGKSMKAVVVVGAGGSDQLELRELPDPQITDPHHIRIRVKAAGINPVDWKCREAGGFGPDAVPFIPGCDGAGEVESIGANVERFKIGDEVYWMEGGVGTGEPGNCAELAVLHEDYVSEKPKSLTMEAASTVPLAYLTAYEALTKHAGITSGQRVLVQAGVGGVGYLGVQIAKHLGAEVYTTISSPEKAQLAKTFGADHCINYQEVDFAEEVLKLTGGVGVNAVFDTIGGPVFAASFSCTAVYGNVTTLDEIPCTQEQIELAKLRNLGLNFELVLTPMLLKMHEVRRWQTGILSEAAKLIDGGTIKIHNEHVFELDNLARAHDLIQDGHVSGKISIRI
jgi:NADPH2:quinone reductase